MTFFIEFINDGHFFRFDIAYAWIVHEEISVVGIITVGIIVRVIAVIIVNIHR